MKFLRSMAGVTRRERGCRRTGARVEILRRVDRRILRYFSHMERMNTDCLSKRVINACLCEQ